MDAERQESQDDQDGTRFWREEREEGAVYNTYLKRVTYLSPARLEDEMVREFSHLMWETQKLRVIKAGTLPRLVEALATVRGELDSSYMNIFLATYRTFATPLQLLQAIVDRYHLLRSQNKRGKSELFEQQQKTLKCVLSVWLDTYHEDFRESPNYPCLTLLENFAREVIPDSDLASRAHNRIERLKKEASSNGAENIQFRFSICDEVDRMIDEEAPKPLTFPDISPRLCAEQLTLRDAELFKKVVPHHCLGAVWGRRDKGGKDAPSVQATVEQFNRVSLRVIATVLKHPDHLKSTSRARLLQKWINIAQELRELKNFSSLRAILSGLQSHPVYRLRRCWSAVPKETIVLFDELSDIFSGENNQLNSRELLMKEATAKFPDLDSQNKSLKRKNMQKRRSWIDNGTVQGTVPYLGTFLTDLTMLDTAMPDITDDGLINFEKHRKEFEVLAQLRLLQSAAQIYNIQYDNRFWEWFDSIRIYSDTESHEMSCAIEPPSESIAKIKKKSASFAVRGRSDFKFGTFLFRYYSCISGTKVRNSGPSIYSCFARRPRFASDSSLSKRQSPRLGHKPSKFDSSSTPRLGFFCGGEEHNSICSIPDTIAASIGPLVTISHSSSTSSVLSSDSDSQTPFRSSDTCVIRVSMTSGDLSPDTKTHVTHVYKSIMLNNTDHTNTVIEKVLEKYSIDDKPDNFCLLQILPDGELLIPERANVFYALNNSVDLNFIVRRRSEQESLKDRKKGRRRLKKLSL
ncbi:ral guanine nucleotide dissociation stimulator-like 1 isoform X2 [Pomacea canaliculata]|uniref:ral guanine nucleotide dissociation stimulator-like 1 isoform X2 n=1 Tax=Pomacea canaliculata TaxID=400727 RepID=UPI000D727948|nr:ral guanine nucleotide dissociation stimulator-like 1 isoform X2 [Pomacea canaliculata]